MEASRYAAVSLGPSKNKWYLVRVANLETAQPIGGVFERFAERNQIIFMGRILRDGLKTPKRAVCPFSF
jgi:hypothetical protein